MPAFAGEKIPVPAHMQPGWQEKKEIPEHLKSGSNPKASSDKEVVAPDNAAGTETNVTLQECEAALNWLSDFVALREEVFTSIFTYTPENKEELKAILDKRYAKLLDRLSEETITHQAMIEYHEKGLLEVFNELKKKKSELSLLIAPDDSLLHSNVMSSSLSDCMQKVKLYSQFNEKGFEITERLLDYIASKLILEDDKLNELTLDCERGKADKISLQETCKSHGRRFALLTAQGFLNQIKRGEK